MENTVTTLLSALDGLPSSPGTYILERRSGIFSRSPEVVTVRKDNGRLVYYGTIIDSVEHVGAKDRWYGPIEFST
jgi:hypothetical protein